MNQYMFVAKDNLQKNSFEDFGGRESFMEKFRLWTEQLEKNGRFIRADQLSEKFRKVSLRNKSFNLTDGPFSETKELITGYFLILANSMNEAEEVAKDCPVLLFDDLEIYEIK